jgi:hypothetical protein
VACGAAGACLFIAVFLADGFVHAGYDPLRDTVSESAIGAGGWIQIANFLVTGTLMVACAAGLRRSVPSVAGPALLAVFGAALIVSGVFVTDPVPWSGHTAHGLVHTVAGGVTFASLTAACWVLARHYRPLYSRITGLAVPVLFITSAGATTTLTGLFQRLAIVAGWTWVALLSYETASRHEYAGS